MLLRREQGNANCVTLKRCPGETISSQGRTMKEGHMRVSQIFSAGGGGGGGCGRGGGNRHEGGYHESRWYGGGNHHERNWYESGYYNEGGHRGRRDREGLLEGLGDII
jgi:hypothetical protein